MEAPSTFGCGSAMLCLSLVPSDRMPQHIGIVNVEHNAFFIRADFEEIGRMGPYNGPSALVRGSGEQFTVERARENHRMTAAPFVHRKNDDFLILVKPCNQAADQSCGHQRVIDRTEQYPVRFDSRQAAQARANGGELPLPPAGIQYDYGRVELGHGTNLFGARAQDDARQANARMACNMEQVFEECGLAVGKQRFRSSHPAGGAGGKDDGGEQAGLFSGWVPGSTGFSLCSLEFAPAKCTQAEACATGYPTEAGVALFTFTVL